MLPGLPGTEVCREIRTRSSGADHHAHGEGLRDRHRRGPRARRRRLRHEAVLHARAARPHPCGAAPPHRARGLSTTAIARGRSRAHGCRPALGRGRRRRDAHAAQGVRAARAADAQRRSGADPRPADRPGVGLRLLRRHQDARRAHQAHPLEDRVRSRRSRCSSSPCAGSATASRPRPASHGRRMPARRRLASVMPERCRRIGGTPRRHGARSAYSGRLPSSTGTPS